jgi:hypothetical protein
MHVDLEPLTSPSNKQVDLINEFKSLGFDLPFLYDFRV